MCTLDVEVLAQCSQELTHPFADGHCFLGHGLWISHIVFHDGLEEFILILPFKGCLWDRRQGMRRRLVLSNHLKPAGSSPWGPQGAALQGCQQEDEEKQPAG